MIDDVSSISSDKICHFVFANAKRKEKSHFILFTLDSFIQLVLRVFLKLK
jgi:hypothetical protein